MKKKTTGRKEFEDYLKHVEMQQSIGVCAKCEWKWTCERCEYVHALRYMVRGGKPSSWWFRAEGRGAKRRSR